MHRHVLMNVDQLLTLTMAVESTEFFMFLLVVVSPLVECLSLSLGLFLNRQFLTCRFFSYFVLLYIVHSV